MLRDETAGGAVEVLWVHRDVRGFGDLPRVRGRGLRLGAHPNSVTGRPRLQRPQDFRNAVRQRSSTNHFRTDAKGVCMRVVQKAFAMRADSIARGSEAFAAMANYWNQNSGVRGYTYMVTLWDAPGNARRVDACRLDGGVLRGALTHDGRP